MRLGIGYNSPIHFKVDAAGMVMVLQIHQQKRLHHSAAPRTQTVIRAQTFLERTLWTTT
jgi:hypothetical protein